MITWRLHHGAGPRFLLAALGVFLPLGVAAAALPAAGSPAFAQESPAPREPPAAPSNLHAAGAGRAGIVLTWTDKAADEDGFRVRRRGGHMAQKISWIETTVGPNTTVYADDTVVPGSEYCYRVAAFKGAARSGYSTESCATASSSPDVLCTADTQDARARLSEMLTGPDPLHVDWRARVGLSHVDPDRLTVVVEDSLCQRLSTAIRLGPPLEDYSMTFFRIDDVYIITVYPTRPAMGYRLTAVIDSQFNVVKPLLAD